MFKSRAFSIILGIAIVVAIAAHLGGCKPPTGPDEIIPTPSPTSTPLPPVQAPHITVNGTRFSPDVLEFSFCCDARNTPAVDEGLACGWALATPACLKNLREQNRSINLIHMRSGPFRTNVSQFGKYLRHKSTMLGFVGGIRQLTVEGNLDPIREAVLRANLEGFAVEMDVIDGWALRHGETVWGDGCEVTRNAPQARHLEWARAVARETAGMEVLFQIGNELSLCNPSRKWVRGIAAAIRAERPAAVIGSDAFPEEVDYETYHGSLRDIRTPSDRPILQNETDNEAYTADQYIEFIRAMGQSGAYVGIWPGPMETDQVADLIRRTNEALP